DRHWRPPPGRQRAAPRHGTPPRRADGGPARHRPDAAASPVHPRLSDPAAWRAPTNAHGEGTGPILPPVPCHKGTISKQKNALWSAVTREVAENSRPASNFFSDSCFENVGWRHGKGKGNATSNRSQPMFLTWWHKLTQTPSRTSQRGRRTLARNPLGYRP